MKRCAVDRALLFCLSLSLSLSLSMAGQTGNQENFSSTLYGGVHLRSIAGAPFSADVVKETTMTLPDGRQVPVVMRGRLFRDAEGRTRAENESVSSAAEPRRFVTIFDPVQQVSIVLDPQKKTATIVTVREATAVIQSGKADQQVGSGRVPAKALAMADAEDLGTSIIEGFRVTGSRRTTPEEAAQNGEQKPRAVVEAWFSPELKIELQARIAGPRLGETITKLENIVAVDPDPALFEVPADYSVKTLSAASR